MTNLKNLVEVLEIRENGRTELEENSCWYSYIAKKGDKILKSYIILQEDLTEEEIKKEIIKHISIRGFENFVSLKDVSPRLRELIEECHGSENEMWFIEMNNEEWLEITEEEQEALNKEICDLDIMEYVETSYGLCEEDFKLADSLVTVFGGISQVVNFNEQ